MHEERIRERSLLPRLAGLIASIGGSRFDARMAELVTATAGIDQFTAFAWNGGGADACLFSWHRAQPGLTAMLCRRYVEGRFFERDLALVRLRESEPRAGLVHRTDIEDHSYRQVFFDRPQLGAKLSVLDGKVYLNFYKRAGVAFGDAEIDDLAAVGPVLSESLLRHRALVAPAPSQATPPRLTEVQSLLARRALTLTPRELAVCARMVCGYSTEAIGLDLAIAQSSVATYRKRAYGKLGISSQHELFALCLSAATAL